MGQEGCTGSRSSRWTLQGSWVALSWSPRGNITDLEQSGSEEEIFESRRVWKALRY